MSTTYAPQEIKTISQLEAIKKYGTVGVYGYPVKKYGGKKCVGRCSSYPKFNRWTDKTKNCYCRTCEKSIPISDIILTNRCPCCKMPVRWSSTWTTTKRLRIMRNKK